MTTRVHAELNEPASETPVAPRSVPPADGQAGGSVRLNGAAESGNTAPPVAANNQLVKALRQSAIFGEYQRAFEEATGLPLTLRAVEGWQLAHHGNRRQNGFCALMSQSNHACSACLRMQQEICDGVNGVPCTLRCAFGLNESAVGVKIGKEIIAYLQTGQVFFAPPNSQQTSRALERVRSLALDVDEREAARRYTATPVVPPGEYQARIRLLQFFADQLGLLANQIVLQQKVSEPPQITRARQFIEANYREELSLAVVARQAGMSSFYFCKMFKKFTGVPFARYVSAFRVEKAKNLLLNPNYRVSEIAFEVGFQSLTHFNRIFRRLAGQSPSEYRQQAAVKWNTSK